MLFVSLLAAALAACATVPKQSRAVFEASKDCGTRPRCFAKVQDAVLAAEAHPAPGRVDVRIGAGQFEERVKITRDGLVLTGAGAAKTRVFNALAAEHALASALVV